MKINDFVKIRNEKFGCVIFDTLKEKVFAVNETGKEILSLIEKGFPLEEIINFLMQNYDSSKKDEIEKDVYEFISFLKENSIIQE